MTDTGMGEQPIMQSKWFVRSMTVLGAAIAAAGAIWGITGDQVAEAQRYAQEFMALFGAVLAFAGRLKADSKVTLMPGKKP